jgi:DNA invertase Pin-like site-specific DNA recombinase
VPIGESFHDTLAYFNDRKNAFVAVTQPVDTTTSTGKLMLGVLAVVAEFERDILRERTMKGMARTVGKPIGRPPGQETRRSGP